MLPGLLMMAPALGSRCLKLGLRPRLDGCAFLVQVGTYSTYITLLGSPGSAGRELPRPALSFPVWPCRWSLPHAGASNKVQGSDVHERIAEKYNRPTPGSGTGRGGAAQQARACIPKQGESGHQRVQLTTQYYWYGYVCTGDKCSP